jgi:hypothetical protein
MKLILLFLFLGVCYGAKGQGVFYDFAKYKAVADGPMLIILDPKGNDTMFFRMDIVSKRPWITKDNFKNMEAEGPDMMITYLGDSIRVVSFQKGPGIYDDFIKGIKDGKEFDRIKRQYLKDKKQHHE